jgi:DNA-binding NtrC family response regulator
VIAATNRELSSEVEKGTFRRDLYYRLNVVNVRLTPLRDRREDIPGLITHFLVRHGRSHSLTQEALEALLSYDWPGNVREVENCVQHMVALNSGPLLHVADLPSSLQNHTLMRRGQTRSAAAAAGSAGWIRDAGPLRSEPQVAPPPATAALPIMPLAELERRAILQALEYTKGDRITAATLLGIGRTTLYRKLKEYRLAGWTPGVAQIA